MHIKYLTPSELDGQGQILPVLPEGECTQLSFVPTETVICYRATGLVALDYTGGMSALVLFRENSTNLYYLDRAVQLVPGTRFAIVPLSEDCLVNLHAPEGITEDGFLPISALEHKENGLQFEKIYTFLYQECSHNFYFRGEKHRPYELVYVDRGQLHNLVRGQDILLEQQQFMIIDSNDWHTQYSDLPVNFLTVSFWALDSGLKAVTNQVISLTAQHKSIFQKMLSQDLQDPYANDYLEAQLKILLISLLRQTDTQPLSPSPTDSQWENAIVDRTLQRISENIHRKLSLKELASMVHISVPYLYKLFEEHLGTSPGKYIAKIRIEECKVLLREGKFTMGQISEQMGYSGQQQFSRQFSAICGISPTQYLRSLR